MKINEMSFEQLTSEINRAKFWVEQNPIKSSLELINKMENRKMELFNKKIKGEI